MTPLVCPSGHAHHETIRVDLDLSKHRNTDYPAFLGAFGRTMSMNVYRSELYDGAIRYCPGTDEVSRSLVKHGVWEGFETLVALDILTRAGGRGGVLDFGAHIGWYTVQAALMGYKVTSFEAQPETARVLRMNLDMNGVSDKVKVEEGYAGPDGGILKPRAVALLKCDVEGQEDRIIAKCRRLFESRSVGAAILEVSPCFYPHYPSTCGFIADCGYDVFDIPDKCEVDLYSFASDPLGVTMTRRIPRDEIEARIKPMHQRNWLFMRRPEPTA